MERFEKFAKILFYIVCSLVLVLSLAMIFIEGRILFSGEWQIYDSFYNGMFRYLMRFLLAVIFAFVSISELFKLFSKNLTFNMFLISIEIALVIISILMNIHFTNFFDYLSFRLMICFFTFKFIGKVNILALNNK